MKIKHKRNDESLGDSLTINDDDILICSNSDTICNFTISAHMQTYDVTLNDSDGTELMSFDIENEKIIVDGKDATMNYTAIAEACRKFLAEQIKLKG